MVKSRIQKTYSEFIEALNQRMLKSEEMRQRSIRVIDESKKRVLQSRNSVLYCKTEITNPSRLITKKHYAQR